MTDENALKLFWADTASLPKGLNPAKPVGPLGIGLRGTSFGRSGRVPLDVLRCGWLA